MVRTVRTAGTAVRLQKWHSGRMTNPTAATAADDATIAPAGITLETPAAAQQAGGCCGGGACSV